MQFNEEQKRAITSLKRLILVSAGAGSGKTRILTERFVHLCELRLMDEKNEAGASVDELVAITFTEKAAREMKDRIRKRLAEKEFHAESEKDRLFWNEQKEAMGRAYISTFHSFCQRLLSQYAMAAGLIPNTRVIDEIEAKSRKRSIIKALFEERHFQVKMIPLLEVMSKEQLIESIEQIHDDIREFVIGEDAIASLDVNNMLELQFHSLEAKKSELVKGFHQQAVRCVAAFPSTSGLTKAVQNHIERITTAFSSLTEPVNATSYMTFMDEIMPKRSDKSWLEKAPTLHELYARHWKPCKDVWKGLAESSHVDEQTTAYLELIVLLLKEFSNRYVVEKEQAGVLDFTDLQQKAVALLKDDSIKEACRRQFRHIMIDEFQDTNRLQMAMLERIDPLFQFIVGDQKQSIYRFRGANVSLMNEREELAMREEWAESILMNTNYRTSAPIINAVNELFSHAMASERTKPYETVYAPLVANRNGEKENDKCVEVTILPKQEEEERTTYQVLASRIIEMVESGLPRVQKEDEWKRPNWSDIAILIPARSHLLSIERALTERGIPYVVSGGIGFYSRREVVDFITILRWLNRPFEDVHLLALLRSPLCGLSVNDFLLLKDGLDETESFYELVYDDTHPNYRNLPESVTEVCGMLQRWLEKWTPFRLEFSLEEALTTIFTETGLRSSLLLLPNGLQKVRNVEKLIGVLKDGGQTELEIMLAELDERIALSEKEGEAEVEHVEGDVVQIMTIHASKGLEFPIVCLPQLERDIRGDKGRIRFHSTLGIVLSLEKEPELLDEKTIEYQTPGYPIVKDLADSEAKEEAKRLFYVAMTRARDYLYMIGQESNSTQSWLHLVEKAVEEAELDSYLHWTDGSFSESRMQVQAPFYPVPEILKQKVVPISFSVSEVMLFINDPLSYFEQYVIGLPSDQKRQNLLDLSKRQSTVDPSLLGTLVHRSCELRDYGLSIDAAIMEAMVENEDQIIDTLAYEAEIRSLMENYTEEHRKQLGETVANEWSFAAIIDGIEVIGEIDKVVQKDGKLALIDFKTNRFQISGKELLNFYRPQLYLYKMAYEQQTGAPVDSIALYVLRDKEQPLQTVKIDEKEEEAIRNALQSMKSLRLRKAGKEEYEALSVRQS
ncbi:UvrD-helicase domain-containing protein [bacterium LRH843]|nr:UvrD-helicase domain-containing protein [bacterium LRH843]